MNKLLLNTTTYKTYSEAITNSLDTISLEINKIDSRNKNIIANNKEIKTNHTNDDMRKSDPINTSTEDKNNEYKLVIRNIEKANCNINYINNILKYLDLSTQIISNIEFGNKTVFLLFTSLFNKRLFMARKINLINSNFNKLLILPFLSKQIIKYGKILYHSTKSNLVNEKKCVFNYKSNIYELRSIINNKINWYEKPMYISDSVEKQFNESYDKFILSLLNTNKNNNNNNHNNRYTNSRYVQNNSVSNTNTQNQ